MKNTNILIFLYFSCSCFAHANTYVWEDYDDFSGSSLDTNKWGTKYLGGGIEPYVSNGKLVLSGNSGDPSATKVVKSGWEGVFAGDDGGQAWVYPKDSDIVGIEAEFLIPSSASSKSGLQLGVASLNPLSYATVELNADPNSPSQYSNGFGFYHFLNGSETENFGTTQRDTTHKLGASLIDGKIKLYVDGETRYEGEAGTFNTDMFYLNGFNDYQSQGLAFELTADNARVLRRVTTTTLDGSVLILSSTDDVSETLAFENGTFTSTFTDPEEGAMVTANQTYILDQNSDNSFKITLSDGDTYEFDESTNTGTLIDYEDGVIDSSGSWNFTYSETIDSMEFLAVKPGKMAGGRDLVYLQTPNGPELLEDAGEINFDLELVDQPTVTAATLKVDGQAYDLTQNEGPAVFRTRYGYGNGEVFELYDVESSSDSDWSSYANGKEFEFSLTVGGNEYAYLHELPGEAALPTPPHLSVTDADSWKVDQDGYDYLEVPSTDKYRVTWDAFDTSDSRDFIQVSLVELIGEDEDDIFEDIILPATATDYEIDGSLLERDKYYLFYVEFLNITQSENPNGFTHAPASDSSEFILRSSASSVTALGFMLSSTEPVTVVSDPNGQAVVVQVDNDYRWNDTLDGVTLWSVSGSEREGDWYGLTAKFSGGKLIYGFDQLFADDVSETGANSAPYEIDQNGYIKSLEGDGDYQYYNVVSVEDGVIGTIQNDQGVESVADDGVNQVDQWFFTTRAAAEEFYYSKVNPKDWMWFDYYPWVYSNEEQDWLYFHPSGGTLMYWSNKGQAWRQFN